MWMSKQWNGVPDAFRFFVTIILVLIYLVQRDGELDGNEDGRRRAPAADGLFSSASEYGSGLIASWLAASRAPAACCRRPNRCSSPPAPTACRRPVGSTPARCRCGASFHQLQLRSSAACGARGPAFQPSRRTLVGAAGWRAHLLTGIAAFAEADAFQRLQVGGLRISCALLAASITG